MPWLIKEVEITCDNNTTTRLVASTISTIFSTLLFEL